MCGRMCCVARGPAHLAAVYGVPTRRWYRVQSFRPSANLHPGMACPVVVGGAASRRFQTDSTITETEGCETTAAKGASTEGAGGGRDDRALVVMRWGLVPSYTKKDERPDHYRMFNARCETVCQKATFKRLVNRHRCVIAVDGFYEWQKLPNGEKQPYYVRFSDSRPLTFAGLWDIWHHPTDENPDNVTYTFTFMTTNPCKRLAWLHDRMPVIFKSREQEEKWLDVVNCKAEDLIRDLSKPYDREDLVCIMLPEYDQFLTYVHTIVRSREHAMWCYRHAVHRRMGSIKYQDNDCNEPVALPGEKQGATLKTFFKGGSPSTCVTSAAHGHSRATPSPAKNEHKDTEHMANIRVEHMKAEEASPGRQHLKRAHEDGDEIKPDIKSSGPSIPSEAAKSQSGTGEGSAKKKAKKATPPSTGKGQKTLQSYFEKGIKDGRHA